MLKYYLTGKLSGIIFHKLSLSAQLNFQYIFVRSTPRHGKAESS